MRRDYGLGHARAGGRGSLGEIGGHLGGERRGITRIKGACHGGRSNGGQGSPPLRRRWVSLALSRRRAHSRTIFSTTRPARSCRATTSIAVPAGALTVHSHWPRSPVTSRLGRNACSVGLLARPSSWSPSKRCFPAISSAPCGTEIS